ncbi:hypothetical protein F66182_2464 [Fusarium sp. NRRL 66182]|nr:hypothetical protein F66182_2464 [Fusarium sp. NRRL 66182]
MSQDQEFSGAFNRGLKIRGEVLGEQYVSKAVANMQNEYWKPAQELITEYAWGNVWTRPGLDRKQRSLLTLAFLTAQKAYPELALHTKGALRNGLTEIEIREAVLQSMIYLGVPVGIEAMRVTEKAVLEYKAENISIMTPNVKNVTEFSYVALHDGANVFDESSDAGKTYQHVLDTALRQPGAQRVYTGLEIENPSNVWLFLDWDSLEDHQNYPKSADHGPVIESLKPLFDFSKSFNKHVTVTPFPPEDVLDKQRSPVTEVLLAFFPSDYDVPSRATATRRLEEFAARALKTSADWRGISYGWSVENDVPVRGDETKSGAMLAAFIGWPSIEAHQKFRETAHFKDNIGLLREIPGLVKLSAFHGTGTQLGYELFEEPASMEAF